jgi:hypothetical protein
MQHATVTSSLTQQAFDFFFWFSRFEAALKEDGYLRNEQPNSVALPGWDQFVAKWAPQYQPSANATRLISLAPARQMVGANKSLTWGATPVAPGASQLATVVAMLKTVRNNLFHGGKHGSADWDNPKRTGELLDAARPVLDELAELAGPGFASDFQQIY